MVTELDGYLQHVKLKATLPYDFSLTLQRVYSKSSKSTYHRDTCIPVLIIISVTIIKLCNHPRCSSTEEWITKLLCLYTTDYYIKKNDVLSFVEEWYKWY